MKNKRPIAIDLFAGAGGLSLGFEQAGFDVSAAVEIDPIHCAVHKYNFPNTKTICASIVDLTGESIRKKVGLRDADIDCVFGGPPCQGFSLIGKRVLDDPRNHLVFHFVRLVKELNPKYFVFENVKGLTVGKQKQILSELVSVFKEIGYEVVLPYRVLNAADFGVPQDRRRLFLLGCRKECKLPEYPEGKMRVTVEEAIQDLPNADEFEALLKTDSIEVDFETTHKYALKLRGLLRDKEDYSLKRDYNLKLLTSSLRTVHTDLSRKRFSETDHGKTEPVSRFRKLDPSGLCNTLRAGTDSARGAFTSPRPIHPYYPRVITVREAARLHSFPDWFRFHSTKWHGFRQIGNSVPPLLGRAVASQIVRAMGLEVKKPRAFIDMNERPNDLLSMEMRSASAYFGVPYDVIPQRIRTAKSDPAQKEMAFVA